MTFQELDPRVSTKQRTSYTTMLSPCVTCHKICAPLGLQHVLRLEKNVEEQDIKQP